MASLPSPASWRRSSSSQQILSESVENTSKNSSQLASSSESFSLNRSQDSEISSASATEVSPIPSSSSPTKEIRTCWICQQDSSDDAPGQEWRTPCPCSLTAHDECLLEWITSEEALKPGDIQTTHVIKCPQCQAPINIQRPRDFLVQAAGKVQSIAKTFVVPTAASALLGCFYSGFLVYGVNTLHVVFGSDEAARIMAPDPYSIQFWGDERLSLLSRFIPTVFKTIDPFFPALESRFSWKLFAGLPMIAPTLVLLRTTVADKFFSIVPMTYFLFRPITYRHLNEWPPSPSLTFAVLPYFRTLYNELYRHTFADLEKQWDAAVQRKPREGETAEQVAQERNRVENAALFDLELEIRNGLEDDDGVVVINEDGGEGGDIAMDQNQGQQQDQGGDAAVRPEGAAPRRQQRLNRNLSTGSLLSTTMGALFFPAISSAMGELLKYSLPSKWVVKGAGRYGSRGLLQEKWGRTVIGGCLFVVLKDTIVLYCKWKKARDFGKKKILNYVGKRGSDAASRSMGTQA